MIFVRTEAWERIRGGFSEAEKVALRAAVTGESICPAGVTIDPLKVDDELLTKLRAAMKRSEELVSKPAPAEFRRGTVKRSR